MGSLLRFNQGDYKAFVLRLCMGIISPAVSLILNLTVILLVFVKLVSGKAEDNCSIITYVQLVRSNTSGAD